jgi:hypothetical protein
MAEKRPELRSIVDLVAIAARYPARALPAGHHPSYPAPVLGPDGLRVAFLYCRAEIVRPGEGLSLTAPSYVAFVDARTAMFEELRAVTPGELGLGHAEGEVLGTTRTQPERLDPALVTKELRLYQTYDLLLPSFAAGQAQVDLGVQAAAREHEALFAELAEAPLLPYYRAVAGPFFAWRDRAVV